jgi:hypothetical protein
MQAIIFIVAVIIEIGFALYCIFTKSLQKKYRSFIRIAEFAAFLIFMLAAGIKWDFRWYGIATLLFILAAISAIRLFRSNISEKLKTRQMHPNVRIIIKSIAMLILIFIAFLPAFIFPEHDLIETTGQYKVLTAQFTYTDNSRIETYTDTGDPRSLNVMFWYPQIDSDAISKTFPLIVFSHGSFGVKTSNESLFNELASHGYVVCSIDHTYQSLFTTNADGSTTWISMDYMREVSAQDAHTRKQQSYQYFQKWMGIRTADINFVINSIISESAYKPEEQVYKIIELSKIGVMGHSLGGSAALGIGRMRSDVKAVIALESPFLDDIVGVKDDEFVFLDSVYPIPVLNVYSDASWSHLSEWEQYAENYRLLTQGEATAFNVHISGAGHLDLTDLALTSPVLTGILNQRASTIDPRTCLKIINKICLEFFDSTLKNKGLFSSAGSY